MCIFMNDRNYIYNFALDDFMTYLQNNEYDITAFSAKILYNALVYADNHFHTLDQLAYFISDLTDIDYQIICAYIDDSYLTEYGKQCKKEFWLHLSNTGKYLYA